MANISLVHQLWTCDAEKHGDYAENCQMKLHADNVTDIDKD